MNTGILDDLRFGLRALAKSRGFAVVATLSLALGIGANTTVFTLLNAILIRPLPVSDPNRLVAVNTIESSGATLLPCSFLNYKDLRDRNTTFSSLFLYTSVSVGLTEHGDPQTVMTQMVTGNYFSALGVNPVVGRGFLPEEDVSPGARPVAVISYGLWVRLFGRDPQITARSLKLNGSNFQIVGVAPQGFQGIASMFGADLFVPMMMYQQVFPTPQWVNQRRALFFLVAGRLKPGVSVAQAEGDLQSVATDLERQFPVENRGRRVKLTSISEGSVNSKTRTSIQHGGTVLLIVSALVLLIACANVANLQLARAAGRSREITVRLALGASRWQLIRQLLAESVVLSLAGAVVGLLLAVWARDILWSIRPPILRRAGFDLSLDSNVLLYTLVVSLGTGILFGLIPGFRATRTDLSRDLKERGGQSASTGGWHPRSILVMAQMALSLIALVGAGLFVRSLRNANRMDPGFDAAHLAVVSFNLSGRGYDETSGREFFRGALALCEGIPGVDSAALAKDEPFSVPSARTLVLQGQDASKGRVTLAQLTWPGYFHAVRMPLLRGRDFNLQETNKSPRVAIVNEAAAALFWPGVDPVGQVISFFPENLPVEVIGVARNANYLHLAEDPQPMVYLSMIQYYFPYAAVYLHTKGDPDTLLHAARQQVRTLDGNLVVNAESAVTTLQQTLWTQKLSANLLAIFGLLAMLLATIGIYGVISYSVYQRKREMGIRLALGASSGAIQTLILREGIRLVTIGVVVGTLVALAASRAVDSLLFVMSAVDALTFVVVPAILTLVAAMACWLPAMRAARVDPAVALREE
jgi:predicted permease